MGNKADFIAPRPDWVNRAVSGVSCPRPVVSHLRTRWPAGVAVSVGTLIAKRPPHGSRRALLTHRAARSISPASCTSRGLNPIEQLFAKIKALLRKNAARILDALIAAIADALIKVTPIRMRKLYGKLRLSPSIMKML
jgi:hypothetical protein